MVLCSNKYLHNIVSQESQAKMIISFLSMNIFSCQYLWGEALNQLDMVRTGLKCC